MICVAGNHFFVAVISDELPIISICSIAIVKSLAQFIIEGIVDVRNTLSISCQRRNRQFFHIGLRRDILADARELPKQFRCQIGVNLAKRDTGTGGTNHAICHIRANDFLSIGRADHGVIVCEMLLQIKSCIERKCQKVHDVFCRNVHGIFICIFNDIVRRIRRADQMTHINRWLFPVHHNMIPVFLHKAAAIELKLHAVIQFLHRRITIAWDIGADLCVRHRDDREIHIGQEEITENGHCTNFVCDMANHITCIQEAACSGTSA